MDAEPVLNRELILETHTLTSWYTAIGQNWMTHHVPSLITLLSIDLYYIIIHYAVFNLSIWVILYTWHYDID